MSGLNLTWGGNTPATQKKLQELVLYIAKKTAAIDDFGTTKINKTLYNSDMAMFLTTGASITGAQYHRIANGPVPKHILGAERELEKSGYLKIDKSIAAHKRIARREPDMTQFSDPQISMIDTQIDKIKGDTSTKVSDDSHDIRWHAVPHQGLIPYEFAFLSGKATEQDKTDAKSMAVELGW